jgi:plastocyanin
MRRKLVKQVLVSVAGLLYAVHAHGDVVVTDDGFSFSPDPVNIVVGEAVYWQDDGSGPYQIISDSGAWAPFDTPGGIRFTQTGNYSYHDDAADFGTIHVAPNVPPSVTITNPVTNAVLTAPATFVFGADASDSDSDGLSDVEFYVGTNLVDDVFSPPFTTTLTNLAAGTYSLMVIAYDNAGAKATNSIAISVQNITLTAPRLVAGQLQFNASGLTIGQTNVLQSSTNLASTANWVALATNVATASSVSFTNSLKRAAFFRLLQLP